MVRRRGKAGKHGKVGLKKQWWVLAQVPYSPQGNRSQSPRVGPWKQGDRPPDAEANPESRIVKGWEDKRDRGLIPETFT